MPRQKPDWARANRLRHEMSKSEQRMWLFLRGDQMGVRFRRQYPVSPFVLDFYCPELKLNIEVDGEQHDPTEDAQRDTILRTRGIEIWRIPSLDVWDELRLHEFLDHIAGRVVALRSQSNP